MSDPLIPAAPVTGLVDRLHVRVDERRAELLRELDALRQERDDHEAVCLGVGAHLRRWMEGSVPFIPAGLCFRLWALDERLRIVWAELVELGTSLADAYAPMKCAPDCAEHARELAAVTPRNLLFRFTRDERTTHHVARCTWWDDGECICEAPIPAIAS